MRFPCDWKTFWIGLERGWKVADTESSILSTMPAIMETSGISVNSMMDGALFAGHLDDAEEARENDEELEALERMVELRRFSRASSTVAAAVPNDHLEELTENNPSGNGSPAYQQHREHTGDNAVDPPTANPIATNSTSTGGNVLDDAEPTLSSEMSVPYEATDE
uniref:Uncharacterized protein n=1 Tax=Anopheles maculatus TaxID=74869 RepID=A0A182T1N9_9DIPT